MADERERDTARTPDQRMQHSEQQRQDDRSGPSPYDTAPEDAPDDRVITKGEREKPGPTSERAEASTDALEQSPAQQDGMPQTNQVDRGDSVSGGTGGMSGSLEDEEALEASEETGSLGGSGLHRRINNEDDMGDDHPDDAA